MVHCFERFLCFTACVKDVVVKGGELSLFAHYE
jgi:hypothetical protein